MKPLLPQQCPLLFVWLTGVLYVAGLVLFPLRGELLLGGVWLVGVPLALWGYIRIFPLVSGILGYGRVTDEPAPSVVTSGRSVTMYGSVACPFCPIVETRLRGLEERMGFELRLVDVTLNPALALRQGIRSVPVVEVEDRRLVGHATTRELVDLIAADEGGGTAGSATSGPAVPPGPSPTDPAHSSDTVYPDHGVEPNRGPDVERGSRP